MRRTPSSLPARGFRVAVVVLLLSVTLAACKGSGTSAASGATSNGTASSTGTAATPAAAGCASVGTKSFAKTKFLLHAGLATGAFHRYIYKPLKGQQFSAGAEHRVSSFIEAGAAGLFIVHELKLAREDAAASSALCRLTAPLDNASTALSSLTGRLKGGSATPADLDSANTSVDALSGQSAGSGATIHDVTPPADLSTSGGN